MTRIHPFAFAHYGMTLMDWMTPWFCLVIPQARSDKPQRSTSSIMTWIHPFAFAHYGITLMDWMTKLNQGDNCERRVFSLFFTKKENTSSRCSLFKFGLGNRLSFRVVIHRVLSLLAVFTTVFGMGTGVFLPLGHQEIFCVHCTLKTTQNILSSIFIRFWKFFQRFWNKFRMIILKNFQEEKPSSD